MNKVAAKNSIKTELSKSAQEEMLASWGVGHIDNSDVIIPKLFILQGISKAVITGEFSAGQIVDSVKLKLLGDLREKNYKPLRFITFMQFKSIVEHEVVNVRNSRELKYVGTKLSSEVGDLPRSELINGREIERTRQLNFYLFPVDTLDDDTKLPLIMTFKKTSYAAGKILVNHFSDCGHAQAMVQEGKKVSMEKTIPAVKIFELNGKLVSNEKGSFYVPEIKETGEVVNSEGILKAFRWYKMLSAGKDASGKVIKTDEREEEEESFSNNRASGRTEARSEIDVDF